MSTQKKQITILFKGKRVVSLHRPAPPVSSSATVPTNDDVKTKHPHSVDLRKRPRDEHIDDDHHQDDQQPDLKRRAAPAVSSSAIAASAHPVGSANDDVRTKHPHSVETRKPLKKHTNDHYRDDDLKKSTKPAAATFKPGEEVEVRSDEEGFKGAWYPATIAAILGDDRYVVKYRTLLTDDEEKLLRDKTWSRYIRPRRPRIRERPLEILDKVDAWFNDGWWEGQITKRLPHRKWSVYFETYNEEIVFPDSKLRLRLKWLNSRWVRPSKSTVLNNTAATGTKIGWSRSLVNN